MRKRFSGNFLMLVVGLGLVFTLCQAMAGFGAGETDRHRRHPASDRHLLRHREMGGEGVPVLG